MASTLRSTITDLAHSFATSLLEAIRSHSLEDILAESGSARGASSRGGAPRGGAGALRSAPGGGRRRGGRLARRSADDISELVDRIVTLLAASAEGLRAEQIRAELGLEAKELPRPLAEALSKRLISKSGQKRATTYFAKGGTGRTSASKAGGRKARASGARRKAAGGRKKAAAEPSDV